VERLLCSLCVIQVPVGDKGEASVQASVFVADNGDILERPKSIKNRKNLFFVQHLGYLYNYMVYERRVSDILANSVRLSLVTPMLPDSFGNY
jgi:hypothetical protein